MADQHTEPTASNPEEDGRAIPERHPLSSIPEMKELLQAIAEIRDAKGKLNDARQGARNLLDRVLGIAHRQGTEFVSPSNGREQAQQLNDAISARLQLTLQLAIIPVLADARPFFDLRTLLEGGDIMDEDLWIQMQEALTQKFSRALAMAAVRGRLAGLADAPIPRPQPKERAEVPSGVPKTIPAIARLQTEMPAEPKVEPETHEIKPSHALMVRVTDFTQPVAESTSRPPGNGAEKDQTGPLPVRIPEVPAMEPAVNPVAAALPPVVPAGVVIPKPCAPVPTAAASPAPVPKPGLSKPSNAGSPIKNEIMHTLQCCKDIPAFSATTQKLMDTVGQRYVTFSELAEVVRLDPGLASKYLRLANSAMFGGQNITDISHALLRLGFDEIRRLATGVEVIDRLSHLCEQIDWNQFWLHSLLTAQLTERLAHAYQPMSGKEYVAGLLHDVGKLFLQKYYPQQFNSVIMHSVETGCSLFDAEIQFLGVTHPELGSALCEKWRLHEEITHSIRFHHEPDKLRPNGDAEKRGMSLLATCICVGDSLAKVCDQRVKEGKPLSNADLTSIPEWVFLAHFTPRTQLDLNLETAFEKAKQTIAAVSAPIPTKTAKK